MSRPGGGSVEKLDLGRLKQGGGLLARIVIDAAPVVSGIKPEGSSTTVSVGFNLNSEI